MGMVLPQLVFQQEAQQKSLATNGIMLECSVCSVVGDTSSSKSSYRVKRRKALDRKPTESTLLSVSCQTSSNCSDEVSTVPDGEVSVRSSSNGQISNMLKGEKHVKKATKKKKRKKGKRSSSNVISVTAFEMSGQPCHEAENISRNTKPLPLQPVKGTGNRDIIVSKETKPSLGRMFNVTVAEASTETSALKGLLLGSLKFDFSRITLDGEEVDKHGCTKLTTKQARIFPAFDVTSKELEGEPSLRSPKCAGDSGDILTNTSSSFKQSCISGHCPPVSNNDNPKMDVGQSVSTKTICEARELHVNEGKVIFHSKECKYEGPRQALCFGSLSEIILASPKGKTCSSSNINVCKGANKTDRNGSAVGIKTNKPSSEVAIVTANKSTEQEQRRSLNGMLHMRGLHNLKQSGKENSSFTRQRADKNIGQMGTSARKEFLPGRRCRFAGIRMATGEATLLAESNFSSRPSYFAENFTGFGSSVYLKDKIHGQVLEDSFQWVPWQNFCDGLQHKVLAPYHPAENKDGRSREVLDWSAKWDKGMRCRKEFWVRKSIFHGPRTRAAVFQKGILEARSIEHQYSSWGQITCDNQHNKHNLSESHDPRIVNSGPACKRTSVQMLSNLLDGDVKTSACFKSNRLHDKIIKKDSKYMNNPLKQIPVGFIDAAARNCVKDDANKISLSSASCEVPNLPGIRIGVQCADRLATHGGICFDKKNITAISDFWTKDSSVFISSQMAFQIQNASYRPLIASECVKFQTGSPVAEFEKILSAAAPVVFPSFVHGHYDACIRSQCIPHAICRRCFSDILLVDVWSWYEELGNYGLEVKVEPSQNVKRGSGDVAPFHAYFVPSLSAVQLFRHSQPHGCNPRSNTDAKKSQDGMCSLPSTTIDHFLSEKTHPNCSEVEETDVTNFSRSTEKNKPETLHSSDESSLSNPALVLFDDPEVLFEYFEHERPEQRKPLFEKIKELAQVDMSSHHVYGDPSNLRCKKLQDLHPASWYSVAWYPIYRIPDGTFRASFLTYHSLGHLVKKNIRAESTETSFCIVSPVLGMESYNAQGECWFNVKEPAKFFSRNGMPFNSSEILKEQLKTLEETAAIFSRGEVYKSQVKVRNRHPDYEFFLSRK